MILNAKNLKHAVPCYYNPALLSIINTVPVLEQDSFIVINSLSAGMVELGYLYFAFNSIIHYTLC
jgi:hypothetical protein